MACVPVTKDIVMAKAAIISILPLLFVAGCISTSEKLINKSVSRGRGSQHIRFEDIQACPDVLDELFSLCACETLTLDNVDIHLRLYKKKKPARESGLVYFEEAPGIVVVSSADKRVILKMDAYVSLAKKIRYKIPKITPPILCICNPNGGNCWNCSPWYVLSLEGKSFLENLGKVSAVWEYKTGDVQLFKYEDIWEGGLGWFSHVSAPGAIIYYQVEHGKLVPDVSKNTQHWRNEIKQFDVRIEAMSEEISKDTEVEVLEPRESPLLRLILFKFLRYRLLGDSEKGWKELRKDLRQCDDQYFFFHLLPPKGDMKVRMGRWPIEAIEKTVKESLENAQRFKRPLLEE
jgi:hypothetical protein